MTTRRAKSGIVIFGTLGTLGVLIAAALGADTPTVIRETFGETAERWGIFAAVCVVFIASSIAGLFMVVRFTMTTMRDCIDDNSLSHLHLSRVLTKRPCLHDSDLDMKTKELEDDSTGIGETGRRVLARRQRRESKQTG